MKITRQERLKVVREHLDKNVPIAELTKKYQYDPGKIKYWITLFQLHGEKPFSDLYEERTYTREEKFAAIEIVMGKRKSIRQLAAEMGLPNPGVLHDWVTKFKEEGPDGIQISRGRKTYKLHADRQKYLADKELKARLVYLEAENAYLKKAYSLIQEKNKLQKKKRE